MSKNVFLWILFFEIHEQYHSKPYLLDFSRLLNATIFREKFVREFDSNNTFSANFTALRFLAHLSSDLFNNSRIQHIITLNHFSSE